MTDYFSTTRGPRFGSLAEFETAQMRGLQGIQKSLGDDIRGYALDASLTPHARVAAMQARQARFQQARSDLYSQAGSVFDQNFGANRTFNLAAPGSPATPAPTLRYDTNGQQYVEMPKAPSAPGTPVGGLGSIAQGTYNVNDPFNQRGGAAPTPLVPSNANFGRAPVAESVADQFARSRAPEDALARQTMEHAARVGATQQAHSDAMNRVAGYRRTPYGTEAYSG